MPFWENEQRQLEERRKLFAAEMNGIKIELIRMNSQFPPDNGNKRKKLIAAKGSLFRGCKSGHGPSQGVLGNR